MTEKQYLKMRQAARRDSRKTDAGYCRKDGYVVIYTKFGGYEAYAADRSAHADFYEYARACRRLAQLQPGSSAEQLADYKKFLEVYKK